MPSRALPAPSRLPAARTRQEGVLEDATELHAMSGKLKAMSERILGKKSSSPRSPQVRATLRGANARRVTEPPHKRMQPVHTRPRASMRPRARGGWPQRAPRWVAPACEHPPRRPLTLPTNIAGRRRRQRQRLRRRRHPRLPIRPPGGCQGALQHSRVCTTGASARHPPGACGARQVWGTLRARAPCRRLPPFPRHGKHRSGLRSALGCAAM